MLQRTGRGFRNDSGQSRSAALRNEDTVYSRCLSGPHDCPKVVRIFHSIKQDEEWRLALLAGSLEDVLRRVVGLGRNEGNDTLVIAARNQAVEGRRRLDMNRNPFGPGLLHEFGKLPIRP
jgi:hypothetical protein